MTGHGNMQKTQRRVPLGHASITLGPFPDGPRPSESALGLLRKRTGRERLVTHEPTEALRAGGRWQGLLLNKAHRVRADINTIRADATTMGQPGTRAQLDVATTMLRLAEAAATTKEMRRQKWSGDKCDEAWRCVHEAEARVGALLPPADRVALLEKFRFDAASLLDPNDPLLALATQLSGKHDDLMPNKPVTDNKAPSPAQLRGFIRRYRSGWDDRYKRGQSYRNQIVMMTAVANVFLVVLIACAGFGIFAVRMQGGEVQLTESPNWDPDLKAALALIAIGIFGAVGGLLAGAAAISRMGGVYNPSRLPMHALIFKVQMGALSGIVGVLLLLAAAVPEIHLSTWGQVVLWALVFGVAQQTVTFLVDNKVKALITSEPQETKLRK